VAQAALLPDFDELPFEGFGDSAFDSLFVPLFDSLFVSAESLFEAVSFLGASSASPFEPFFALE